uniref:Uncharacterized protein n=1 Tax=Candidatus Kentrum sp. TC TaxID=2126339 RepID=A0A450YV25_9GAMM|nr:MAG: hypothetical protein BECKTC1821E_GA0114239_10476 [Candidatus Kentron sp. TC]
METISKGHFILKRIFEDNWKQFLSNHRPEVGFSAAYNVWKVMNHQEPETPGYAAYACPDHPDRITHIIPRRCKSRFCPVRVKVQVDKWEPR